MIRRQIKSHLNTTTGFINGLEADGLVVDYPDTLVNIGINEHLHHHPVDFTEEAAYKFNV